jgi:serine/threonine-protein kinase RsbW
MSTNDDVRSLEATPESLRRSGFEGHYREVCLRRPDEVLPLLERVTATLTALGYPPRDCGGVRLALEEAVVNGLRHGNRGDPRKRVRVCYFAGPEAVVAEVEDEGPGFDPEKVPDPTAPENLGKPSGRGLLLMRHFMTWVRFSRRGNCVAMGKRRTDGPAEA